MAEVTHGIYWLKLPITMAESTLGHANAYLIQGVKGYLLVDIGWNTSETFNALRKQLDEISVNIKEISRIVVTHVHPDHYGLAGRMKQLSGATLALHEIEQGFVDSRYVHMKSLLKETGKWLALNGMPRDALADTRDATVGLEGYVTPCTPDIILHGGETITTGTFTFQILWTPGHSPGHVCLYEPDKKVLISGDHILPTITPNVGSHPQSGENPLDAYIKSLKDMRHLDVSLILPGHEEPFTGLQSRIDELIRHHEERSREILKALKAGPRTAYQLVKELTWSVSNNYDKMPQFHKRLAIFETLAHLEQLAVSGRLNKNTRNGIISWQQT